MIPPFQQYLYPFLKLMEDRNIRNITQVSSDLAKSMHLSVDELAETYETSGQNRHHNRCSWARTWFLKAGILESPKRGFFRISQAGLDLLNSGQKEISQKFLIEHYPSFAEFAKPKKKDNHESLADETLAASDPLNQMEDAFS